MPDRNNHVIVTGGAGCIGSELCHALIDRGEAVTVIDNLSSGKREHISGLLDHPQFRFIEGDLLDPATLEAAMPGAGFVYHLAANPDVKFTLGDATEKDLQQNTIVTHRVLDSMRLHGVKKLAFSSSSAVYGLSPAFPIPESAPNLHPISLYGATKLSCEAMISAFGHLFEMQCWIFRFSNIIGKKVRAKGRTVISDFIHRLSEDPSTLHILGNGNQAKSYMLADECIESMLHVIEHTDAPLNVYNLGCDDWITVRRIAEMVTSTMGLSGARLTFTNTEGGWPGDVPRFRLDVSALNALGWKARHTSEEAVAFAIQAILSSREAEVAACK
ncbi:MAG: NAD-dependent epimerase/dehydratase family protein [Hyphomicrobium sp.]